MTKNGRKCIKNVQTIQKTGKIIGLAGAYCAGKNYVARVLEQRSFPVLDVDKLGHKVIEEEGERLAARFGKDILRPDLSVDRALLGTKVFGKPEELAALEAIIHPRVNQETLDWVHARKEKACVINAALLHRSAAFEMLDAIILVEAPFLVRLLRAKKRDRLPWFALLRRFRSQKEFRSQLFKGKTGKTDIYRVGNSFDCANTGFGAYFFRNRLERRVDEILSLQGIN